MTCWPSRLSGSFISTRRGMLTEMIDVTLTCPSCGHTWLEAQIDPAAWWGYVTPQTIAQRPSCPVCEAPPPMRVTGELQQVRLFA